MAGLPKSVGTEANLDRLPEGAGVLYRGKNNGFVSRRRGAGWEDGTGRVRTSAELWAAITRVCPGKPRAEVLEP